MVEALITTKMPTSNNNLTEVNNAVTNGDYVVGAIIVDINTGAGHDVVILDYSSNSDGTYEYWDPATDSIENDHSAEFDKIYSVIGN